jgi:putative PIN family toxin of toxin-antitoxin system
MVDTNILISALIFPTPFMNILIDKITNEYHLVISISIYNEFNRVVNRKFKEKIESSDLLLSQIPYELGFPAIESQKQYLFEIRDKSDYPILCSAIDLDVDVFITGDKDFRDVKLERPEILTPADFLNKY